MAFHSSRQVFNGSRLVFHGSWLDCMVFHGSSIVFFMIPRVFKVPGGFFLWWVFMILMVPGGFIWPFIVSGGFLMVPGWLFWLFVGRLWPNDDDDDDQAARDGRIKWNTVTPFRLSGFSSSQTYY